MTNETSGSLSGPSARERVLNSYDVLWQVFKDSYVPRFARGPLASRDLARCARVCRAFSGPALRVLWSVLHDPGVLWNLLLPQTWVRPLHSGNHDSQKLQAILKAELWNDPVRWDRFLFYAQYVLRLNYQWLTDDCAGSHVQIARAVSKRYGGNPILASLRTFECLWKATIDNYVICLFCPTITSLHFRFKYEEGSGSREYGYDLQLLFRSLRELAPHLETLELDMFAENQTVMPRALEEIVYLPHVRTLRLTQVYRFCDLQLLATMPGLAELRTAVRIEDKTVPFTRLAFETLRVLDIHGTGPDLTPLFAASSMPALERAKIAIFDQAEDRTDFYACAAAIASAPLPGAFRELHFSLNRTYFANDERLATPVPLASLLRPLFRMHNLERLTVRFDGPLQLSSRDDVFAELALAWPALQVLRLDFRSWHRDGPVPSAAVLVHLARSCAHLREVVLPYLDHSVEPDEVLDAGRLRPHPLRRLFVADDKRISVASTGEVERLSGVVRFLFPNLDLNFRSFLTDTRFPWSQVFVHLRSGCTPDSDRMCALEMP